MSTFALFQSTRLTDGALRADDPAAPRALSRARRGGCEWPRGGETQAIRDLAPQAQSPSRHSRLAAIFRKARLGFTMSFSNAYPGSASR